MKRNFEISLEYNRTDILNKLLVLIFDVKVVNFSEQKVDKNALKEEILKKIPKGEEKFFYLRSYNNKNASFIFEINKWFDSKNKLVETENRYVKRLILNRLPTLITNNVNAVDYTKVIEASFRNYLTKNMELKSKIASSVAENLPMVYYRFKYDGNLNAMKIEVKEQFRHNIMTVLKSKNNPRKELKKMDFDSSVETYLKFMKKK
jgi:hypothetical protein